MASETTTACVVADLALRATPGDAGGEARLIVEAAPPIDLLADADVLGTLRDGTRLVAIRPTVAIGADGRARIVDTRAGWLQHPLARLLAAEQEADGLHADRAAVAAALADAEAANRALADELAQLRAHLARRTTQLRRKAGQTGQTEENLYQLLFGQFKAKFRLPRYDALPARRYEEALTWLKERAAELLPDDPNALPPHQEQLL